MPPKAKAKRDAGPPVGSDGGTNGSARDWSHPDGIPLECVEVDAEFDGTVTNVGRFGVFVDFGAVKDGLLRVPGDLVRAFKRGMEVKNMRVLSVVPEEGKVVLKPELSSLPEPKPRGSRGGGGEKGEKGSGKGGAAAEEADDGQGPGPRAARRSQSAGARPRRSKTWDHEDGMPLEEVKIGDVFEGVVTNVSTSGVFVDIGAVRDARLAVSAKIGRCFRIGDVVQDCTIERVDLERGRMSATLPDPDAAVRDLPPKDRGQKGQSAPKAKAQRPKAKSAPRAKSESRPFKPVEAAMSLEDLHVGDVVDGIVSNKTPYDVFIDIGCGKDARLALPRRLCAQFRKGDQVYGMRVEQVDLTLRRVSVVLDEPELAVEPEGDGYEDAEEPEYRPPTRGRKGSAGRGAAARPASASAGPRKGGGRGAPSGGDSWGGAGTASGWAAPKRAPSAGKGAAKSRPSSAPPPKAAAKAKGTPASQEWRHPGAPPVTRFRAGGIANGVVTHVTPQGVFVDVGAVTDGLLKLPRAIASQFRVGDEVHGMTVEAVDVQAERIILSLEEPELEEPATVKAPTAPRGKGAAPSARGGAAAPTGQMARGRGSPSTERAPPPAGARSGKGAAPARGR